MLTCLIFTITSQSIKSTIAFSLCVGDLFLIFNFTMIVRSIWLITLQKIMSTSQIIYVHFSYNYDDLLDLYVDLPAAFKLDHLSKKYGINYMAIELGTDNTFSCLIFINMSRSEKSTTQVDIIIRQVNKEIWQVDVIIWQVNKNTINWHNHLMRSIRPQLKKLFPLNPGLFFPCDPAGRCFFFFFLLNYMYHIF
jgi:hypothetical protein